MTLQKKGKQNQQVARCSFIATTEIYPVDRSQLKIDSTRDKWFGHQVDGIGKSAE